MHTILTRNMFALLGFIILVAIPVRGADAGSAQGSIDAIELREGLAIGPFGRSRRAAFAVDPVRAKLIVDGSISPSVGDVIQGPDDTTHTWEPIEVGENGAFGGRVTRGGYINISVSMPEPATMMLEASGHSVVFVNGRPRAGDPYGTGFVHLPITLEAGRNDLLFKCGRGQMRARLTEPKQAVWIQTSDATLPDLLVSEAVDTVGAVLVANASATTLNDLVLEVHSADDSVRGVRRVGPILAHSLRKLPLSLEGAAPTEAGNIELRVTLYTDRSNEKLILAEQTFSLAVRNEFATIRRTFVSDIDGSVQYFAVKRAHPSSQTEDEHHALILTLHGAGVQATGQANSYATKTWAHIVAPTNRRPFGFDWEDWGRIDAMEVLDHATRMLEADPSRVYLTGHSMGGHGAWQVGATFPDRFAAIAPSAGWTSFWSYSGAREYSAEHSMEAIFKRATRASDTLALSKNYQQLGVYILHGGGDRNVPADQARGMLAHLEKFHTNVAYHEQEGAGHWWDASDAAGVDCVDWAPMMDFFAHQRRPELHEVREIDFTTVNPAINGQYQWAAIEAQQKSLEPSHIQIRVDPHRRRFVGVTSNVSRLTLDLAVLAPGEPAYIGLDGQQPLELAWPTGDAHVSLRRADDLWQPAELDAAGKGRHRAGPFKHAFTNNAILVYGTQGSDAEDAWAFTKARFDAERFWYRGNGSFEIVSDQDFDAKANPDRNVVLYGNADTNAAWDHVLAHSPIQLTGGSITVGDWSSTNEHLGVLFVAPRHGSDRALVGVIGGNDLIGMRATDTLRYFTSGVAYPDFAVFGPDVYLETLDGVRIAGFFDESWAVAADQTAIGKQ